MNGLPKIDEITALEYTSLKVPYELLNKRFRTAQKSLDRHNFRVREASNELTKVVAAEKVNDIITVGQANFMLHSPVTFFPCS